MEKKNFVGADLEGLLPKSYCEETFCIAREWIVLQAGRQKLYCKVQIVLQDGCIVN